jgi:hypothetical protein
MQLEDNTVKKWPVLLLLLLLTAAVSFGQSGQGGGNSGGNLPVNPIAPNGVPFAVTTTPSGGLPGTYTTSWPGVALTSQTGTTYMLAAADRGTCIEANNAGAQTYTVPDVGGTNFQFGYNGCILNLGAGTITFNRSSASTFNLFGALTTSAQTTFDLITKQTAYFYSSPSNNWDVTVVGAGSSTPGRAIPYVVTTGTGAAYIATFSPAVSPVAGTLISVSVNATCTSATPTINVNAFGAKTITRFGAASLVCGSTANDLTTGGAQPYFLAYDGTNWELINPGTVLTGPGNAGGSNCMAYWSGGQNTLNQSSLCLNADTFFGIGGNGFLASILGSTLGTQTVSGADYTNTGTTPSTVFSWALPSTSAGKNYRYRCDIMWESTAATLVGVVLGVNLSAAPTQLTSSAAVQNTLAGADINGYISNATTGHQTVVTGGAAGVTSTNYWAKIWGTIEGANTAGSTFIIDAAATSGTTANLNIRRGSGCTMLATN